MRGRPEPEAVEVALEPGEVGAIGLGEPRRSLTVLLVDQPVEIRQGVRGIARSPAKNTCSLPADALDVPPVEEGFSKSRLFDAVKELDFLEGDILCGQAFRDERLLLRAGREERFPVAGVDEFRGREDRAAGR